MFEAIHGSGRRVRAGQNLANPSGLLLGAVMMLVHIGETDAAGKRSQCPGCVRIEDGVHTYDIFEEGKSKQKVGTKEFAEAVAQRVGQLPQTLKAAKYKSAAEVTPAAKPAASVRTRAQKDLVGVDVFPRLDQRNSQRTRRRVK